MKQTGTCLSVCRARDFAARFQHVCHDQIGEAGVGKFWRAVFGEDRFDSPAAKRKLNCLMDAPVNFPRRTSVNRVGHRNHDRISKILSVRYNSAAGPSAHESAPSGESKRVIESAEITERDGRLVPAIEPEGGAAGVLQ